MRYIILLKGTRPAAPPPPELMNAIVALGAEATASGALLDTAGLSPSTAGARVRLAGGHLSVMDGPFSETKELISYAIYDLRSKAEAIEWASRFLALHRDHWPVWEGEAEICKVMGPEDFQRPS